jgi:hypothetical protein
LVPSDGLFACYELCHYGTLSGLLIICKHLPT